MEGFMSNKYDLTGKRFGRWTVLNKCDYKKGTATLWHCKCDCGNESDVRTSQLTSGRSQSCGCLANDKAREHNRMDLVGKRFGRLVVESFNSFKNHRATWNCICDCGNTKVVLQDLLLNGSTKSCGCLKAETLPSNFKNLSGRRFGKLVARHYDTSSKKWECICDCGNTTYVSSYNLTSGKTKSCGCAKHEHGDKIGNRYGKLVVTEYAGLDSAGNETMWKCKCDCGNEAIVRSSSLTSGATKSCGCLHKSACQGSTDELVVKEYINTLLPNVVITKSRILDGKEIDLYLPDYKFGIEFNGSAFHATLNGAYRNVDKNLHRDKFLLAKKKDIHLLTIFDVDWWTNSDKIKSYIKFCLTKPKHKIYARNCHIEEIDKFVANSFCDNYHLQGHSVHGSINLGLYYKDTLVSVMCFGGIRLKEHKAGEYELHRYCVRDDYLVVGGASKLHKYFIKKYSPKYIRSYSDNDYFTGGIYHTLGYKYTKQSNQRYYWFLNGKELIREKCQLKYLKKYYPSLYTEAVSVNARNKEDYIMQKLNARKVYRCGNTLWEYIF